MEPILDLFFFSTFGLGSPKRRWLIRLYLILAPVAHLNPAKMLITAAAAALLPRCHLKAISQRVSGKHLLFFSAHMFVV